MMSPSVIFTLVSFASVVGPAVVSVVMAVSLFVVPLPGVFLPVTEGASSVTAWF